VTEIPFNEGVSFPGLIDLSFSTFQSTALDGFDEYFARTRPPTSGGATGFCPARAATGAQ